MFILPYPPSVNHYWRRAGSRTFISREGRVFRKKVVRILAAMGTRPMDGRLRVVVEVYPPDNRKRDLDNVLKALLDALQHGGAFHDDFQIDQLSVLRHGKTAGGCVSVWVSKAAAPQQPVVSEWTEWNSEPR